MQVLQLTLCLSDYYQDYALWNVKLMCSALGPTCLKATLVWMAWATSEATAWFVADRVGVTTGLLEVEDSEPPSEPEGEKNKQTSINKVTIKINK